LDGPDPDGLWQRRALAARAATPTLPGPPGTAVPPAVPRPVADAAQYRRSRPRLTPRPPTSAVCRMPAGRRSPVRVPGGIPVRLTAKSIWSPGRTTFVQYRKVYPALRQRRGVTA